MHSSLHGALQQVPCSGCDDGQVWIHIFEKTSRRSSRYAIPLSIKSTKLNSCKEGGVQQGIKTEIYASIRDIARVTPDRTIEEREGLCRAIATLCELGLRLEEKEKSRLIET